MSFDFFNVSHLAFGSKLTKAFTQLDRLCKEGEETLGQLFQILDIYGQYINRNYPCPFPSRPDAPCRTNEIFDLFNDGNSLKSIYMTEDEKLHVEVNIFKRNTNRYTIATGETTLKEGYAYSENSTSNLHPNKNIIFVEDLDDVKGTPLFQFRVDSQNNINIVGDSYDYFQPSSFDHIIGMQQGEDVLTDSYNPQWNRGGVKSYTASDYECIVCVGYWRHGHHCAETDGAPEEYWSRLAVEINGRQVAQINGMQCKEYIVVYLKPGDVLSGDVKRAFKVKYNRMPVITPTPVPPEPTEIYYQATGDVVGDNWTTLEDFSGSHYQEAEAGKDSGVQVVFPSALGTTKYIIGGTGGYGARSLVALDTSKQIISTLKTYSTNEYGSLVNAIPNGTKYLRIICTEADMWVNGLQIVDNLPQGISAAKGQSGYYTSSNVWFTEDTLSDVSNFEYSWINKGTPSGTLWYPYIRLKLEVASAAYPRTLTGSIQLPSCGGSAWRVKGYSSSDTQVFSTSIGSVGTDSLNIQVPTNVAYIRFENDNEMTNQQSKIIGADLLIS